MLTTCFSIFIRMKYAKINIAIENIIFSNIETMPIPESFTPEKNVNASTAITSSIIKTAISNGTSLLENICFCSSTFTTTTVLLNDNITPTNKATLFVGVILSFSSTVVERQYHSDKQSYFAAESQKQCCFVAKEQY